jgi:hypothetical protein
MLPTFPRAERQFRAGIERWMRELMPLEEPLLTDVRSSRQHEGKSALLTRDDGSEHPIEYRDMGAAAQMSIEDIKNGNVGRVYEVASQMAKEMAGNQVKHMLQRIADATHEVGNVVTASDGQLTKEGFLEMMAKVRTDFDPKSLQPVGQRFVIHPSQVPRVMALMAEWEQDREFVAAVNRLKEAQIEEWRARENNRQLAD